MLGATAVLAGGVPVAVSPGNVAEFAVVESRCPTFSWGEVEDAGSYELVVYRVGDQGEQAEPALRRSLAGSTYSWTPSLDSCLERGGRYAWTVRSVLREESSEWSAPSLFQVAPGPSEVELEEALAVVRDYLMAGAGELDGGPGRRSAGTLSSDQVAIPLTQADASGPKALSFVAGDETLQVGGSPVLTVATSQRLLLCAISGGGWRYWDFGDGTVVDCNTGLIWLKDASCADLPGTDGEGRGDWAAAQAAAAALTSGTCGLTDGSQAGDWRQPTIKELCSSAAFSALSPCPPEAAADSLIDSSVSGSPKVVNAKGDERWSEGDVFVDVKSNAYWSASSSWPNTDAALYVMLFSGNVDTTSKTGGNFYVWPVRGGQ